MREIVLDSRMLGERERAHIYLKEKFSFPGWYGENLDALHDCLCEITETVKIVVDVHEKIEAYTERILTVLEDTAGENENLSLQYGRMEENEKK